jgi:hypothetical protein
MARDHTRATPIRPSRDAVSVAKRPISEISSDQGVSIHGTYEPERPESFRPCAHGTAPQRIGAKDLPSRSRLSYLVSARRPPTNRRRDRHVRRRQPETVAGSATRGFVDGFPADEHPALSVERWLGGSRTEVRRSTGASSSASDCSRVGPMHCGCASTCVGRGSPDPARSATEGLPSLTMRQKCGVRTLGRPFQTASANFGGVRRRRNPKTKSSVRVLTMRSRDGRTEIASLRRRRSGPGSGSVHSDVCAMCLGDRGAGAAG